MTGLQAYLDFRNQIGLQEKDRKRIRRMFFRFAKETLRERELTADAPRFQGVSDDETIRNIRWIPFWHNLKDEDLQELYRVTSPKRKPYR